MYEKDLTLRQLKAAFASGEIAGIASTGCVVRFVFKDGDRSGYLIDKEGAIRRFKSDEAGWKLIEGEITGWKKG